MNKQIFILAMAALGFVACSSDETVASQTNSEANEISFRPSVAGKTRGATETTISSFTELSGFKVSAYLNDANKTSYFTDVEFRKDGSTSNYRSTMKYYWPATGNLNFVAYYPDTYANEFSHGTWNQFTFKPRESVEYHKDFVIAATLDRTKAASSTGVPLAFKHLGSWIELKVYNSKGNVAGNMKATVTGWKLGYLYDGGTYTITQSTASGSGLSTTGSWSYSTFDRVGLSTGYPMGYTETVDAISLSNDGAHDTEGEKVSVGNAMIIVPQTTQKITGTSTYGTNGFLTGAFIAVKLQITDGQDHVLANATGTETISAETYDQWAIWPISNDWVDGYKYTYVIDVSQGGYKQIGVEDQTLNQHKWLDGAEIYFSSVTVTDWAAGSATTVNP